MAEAESSRQWGEQAAFALARVDADSSRGLGFLLNSGFVLASVGPEVPTTAVVMAYAGTEGGPATARVVKVIGVDESRLVVFDLGRRAMSPGNYGPVSPGAPFGSAVIAGDGPVIVTGEVTADGLFLLDRGLPRLQFLRGAPVVQHGLVVGVVVGVTRQGLQVVPMEALADELEAYAPEVGRGMPSTADRPVLRNEFSGASWKTLCFYDGIAARDDSGLPVASALWAAVILLHRAGSSSKFADAVAAGRASIPTALIEVQPSLTPDPWRFSFLAPVLDEARRIQDRLGSGRRMRMRHLVTASLRVWPHGLQELGEDPADLQQRLIDLVARHYPAEEQDVWRELLGGRASPPPPAVATWAGYNNDAADVATDELDVQADVETLCAVLAAKDAVPPMAVGLFGRWGAGKSTFMKLMQNRMGLLADTATAATEQGQATAYCTDIVQIEFNAWHYMDANLWASLAVRIFEGLSVGGDADHDDHEAAELLAELHDRERHLASIDAKIGLAVQDQRLRDVAEQLGVEASRQQLVKLFGQVSRFRRFLRALRLAVFDPRQWTAGRRRTALVVVGVTAVVTAVAAAVAVAGGQWLAALGPSVLAFVGAAAKVVPPAVKALTKVNDVLEAANLKPAEVDERVKGDRQIAEIKQRLAKLDRRQGLYEFVLERAGSEDYRKHFGLISVVRADFEKLAKRLADDAPGRRIVLYVDDLDRCPPDRVVEVLQAVHLLLAFKLFVVVVGVDPRWLLRSLERQYKTVLSSGDGDEAFSESTPQNYLEKIFQIPFALRGMDIDGFGRLVDGMFGPTAATEPAGSAVTPAPSGETSASATAQTDVPMQAPTPPADRPTPPAGSQPSSSPVLAEEAIPPSAIDPNPVALQATSEEVEFMRGVGRLVQTPREAKRLVNLYRLVRASRPPDQLDRFVADAEYEAVITLLAVLVGFRKQARELFDALLGASAPSIPDTSAAGTWRKLVISAAKQAEADDGAWGELSEELLRLDGAHNAKGASADRFARWVPIVERYSFDTALASVAPTLRPPDKTSQAG